MLEGAADPSNKPNNRFTWKYENNSRTVGGNLLLTCAHVISLPLSLFDRLLSPDARVAEIAERSSPQVSLSPVPNSCGAISRRSCTPLCRSYPPLPITCLRVAAISIIILITRSGHGVKDNVVRASVSRTNRFYRCARRSRIFARTEPLAIRGDFRPMKFRFERKFWK